jgi:hypothetical protein
MKLEFPSLPTPHIFNFFTPEAILPRESSRSPGGVPGTNSSSLRGFKSYLLLKIKQKKLPFSTFCLPAGVGSQD